MAITNTNSQTKTVAVFGGVPTTDKNETRVFFLFAYNPKTLHLIKWSECAVLDYWCKETASRCAIDMLGLGLIHE